MDDEKRQRLLSQAQSGELTPAGQRALSAEAQKMLTKAERSDTKQAQTSELINHEIDGLVYSAEVIAASAAAGVADGRYDATNVKGFNAVTGLGLATRVVGTGLALAKKRGSSHFKAIGDGLLAYCAGKRARTWGEEWKAKSAGTAPPAGQAAAPAAEPKGGPAIAGVPNARVLPDHREVARQVHAQHAGRVVMTPPHAPPRGEKGREWRAPQ